MTNRVLALLVVVTIVGVALGSQWLLPQGRADASGHSATRSFSENSVAPGETVTVTIAANNYGRVGRIVETVPDGFTTANDSQTVTFRLLSEGPLTRTYTVTATDSAGPHPFSGTIADESKDSRAIVGMSTVTITGSPVTPDPLPTPDTETTARRSFSATSVNPGQGLRVTITADNYGRVGRIVETLPAGFTSPDADGRAVTLRLLEEGPQTVRYTVTASDTPGSHRFSGTLAAEDKTETIVRRSLHSVTVRGGCSTSGAAAAVLHQR